MKKKILYISIALLIIIITIFIIVNKRNTTSKIETVENENTPIVLDEEEYSIEETTSIGERVTVEIVSPEEPTFMANQARKWEGEVKDIESDNSFTAVCKWEFFLNGNAYQSREDSTPVSKKYPDICTFVSTFIEDRGELRVKLTVDIQNKQEELLDTYTAERNYSVY